MPCTPSSAITARAALSSETSSIEIMPATVPSRAGSIAMRKASRGTASLLSPVDSRRGGIEAPTACVRISRVRSGLSASSTTRSAFANSASRLRRLRSRHPRARPARRGIGSRSRRTRASISARRRNAMSARRRRSTAANRSAARENGTRSACAMRACCSNQHSAIAPTTRPPARAGNPAFRAHAVGRGGEQLLGTSGWFRKVADHHGLPARDGAHHPRQRTALVAAPELRRRFGIGRDRGAPLVGRSIVEPPSTARLKLARSAPRKRAMCPSARSHLLVDALGREFEEATGEIQQHGFRLDVTSN